MTNLPLFLVKASVSMYSEFSLYLSQVMTHQTLMVILYMLLLFTPVLRYKR